MNHSFDIEHARLHGVVEAVLIQNLMFWISHNKANGRHFYQDRTWTYNTVNAFAELFPYLSSQQIRRALDGLIAKGVILGGNFNENKYDRTKWYAFADESIFLDRQSHLSNPTNGAVGGGKTKTDGKPPVNPDNPDGGRATRLAPEWVLPKSWGEWALKEFPSWTPDHVRFVADKFRDHWISQPKSKAVKSDWLATWRNWCRGEPAFKKDGAASGAWFDTASGIEAKAKEVGIVAMPGESTPALKARICAAIENGGKPPAAAPSRLPQAFVPVPDGGAPPGKGDPNVKNALSHLKHLTNVRPKPKDETGND